MRCASGQCRCRVDSGQPVTVWTSARCRTEARAMVPRGRQRWPRQLQQGEQPWAAPAAAAAAVTSCRLCRLCSLLPLALLASCACTPWAAAEAAGPASPHATYDDWHYPSEEPAQRAAHPVRVRRAGFADDCARARTTHCDSTGPPLIASPSSIRGDLIDGGIGAVRVCARARGACVWYRA